MAKLVAIALMIAGIAWLGLWFSKEIEIDSCLDSGGRYDYETESCIYSEPPLSSDRSEGSIRSQA